MTGVIIGKVLDVSLDGILVEDHITKEQIKAISEMDEDLALQIGDTGVFVGNIYKDTIRFKRYEIRKFLDPLYEEDLLSASGQFTMIPVIENPFTEAFVEFLEKRKLLEEMRANEELDARETESTQTIIPDSGSEEDPEDII